MGIFVHTVVWKECLTQVRREGGGSCGQNRVVSGKWKKVMPDSAVISNQGVILTSCFMN